jgi:hypothetical protein
MLQRSKRCIYECNRYKTLICHFLVSIAQDVKRLKSNSTSR